MARHESTRCRVLPELGGRLKSKLGEKRLKASFSSKMLAFLRPNDYPIWDSWVVKNMLNHYGVDLRLKVASGIKDREQEELMRFDELTAWFGKSVATKSNKQALKRFDEYLLSGGGKMISAMKKLDWLLWAER